MKFGSAQPLTSQLAARQAMMGTLAKASWKDISALWEQFPHQLTTTTIRQPEIGLVMMRGRTGGTGAPFNLCEATVTRCVVALEDGTTGFGQCLGREKDKALTCAKIDALWQRDDLREAVDTLIIAPLAEKLKAEQARTKAEVAATKVDFFTMSRES